MSSNKESERKAKSCDVDNESQPLLSSDVSRSSILPYNSIEQHFSENQTYETPSNTRSEATSKQSSVVTIFVIWNTMMGTSLLSMPWAIERAGLITGVQLIIFMGALCFYTSYCVLRTQKAFGSVNGEISDLARIMLGPTAQVLAKIFSWIVLLGSNIVYWILMSNFLFYSVDYIHNTFYEEINNDNSSLSVDISFPVTCPKKDNLIGRIDANSGSIYEQIWGLYTTVPILLGVLIIPLLSFKSATFFTKFNSLGTLSVLYIIVFVFIKGVSWGINININVPTSPFYSPWISHSFPATTGVLALSFFIQNIIVTIMRSNKNQNNNGRDLSIAYTLVILTYIIIGVVFFVTFPLAKTCIEDNFLNNFPSWDILTVLARVFLFFQLFTVFPLISFMLRVQVMTTFFSSEYPSTGCVMFFNAIIVSICIIFAIFLPRIGTVIRFTGAISGFFHVFTLPCFFQIIADKKQNKESILSLLFHSVIPILGAINLIAQFFVSDS
uniref:Amino acid transporter transmembrane domain-containing protein n=1 Tax=Clastoptera arizonana TaxID=38151 RepID=A0A1B6EGR0_9HEMI